MSSVKHTQNKASNSSVSLANSAWSKGPPQSSGTPRAQSPANASNTPTSQPRRQSTLGPNAPPAVKQAPRGMAAGTGHRTTSSINFGSIEATQTPEKKAETATPPATAPVPAMTPATTAPKPAQPPANGIKVVAPTPTQPVPTPVTTSTAPAAMTAPTTASTAPAAAATPPGTTPTPSKQKKVNVHALFQGGGMPSVTTTPPVATTTPSVSAPAPPQVVAPSAPPPRGPASGFNDRNNPVQFPRSPQISRPTLPGPSTSGGQRPAGSPRLSANVPLQHPHQHPMVHPQHHHTPHPGHPMQPPPQWGPAGYYYPHDYNPYMYWGGHPQHQHPHMQQIHQPPIQSSPRPPNPQPRPPSTPPVSNNASPHPPPINTSLQAPPSAPSPSLSVAAPPFVPGSLRRSVAAIRISTPNGDAVTFDTQIPSSPKVTTPIPPKRVTIVRMETEQQKNERLAKEQEEKEREAREKAEKERKEKERIEEEKRAKEEAERKKKEEEERKVREEQERIAREEAERKAEEERKAREEAERKAEEERKAKEEEERRIAEELRIKEEAERKIREEQERKAREEAERLEAERKAKEEAERKAKEEEERKAKEEAEAAARAEAEVKAKEEAEKVKAAAEAKAKAEAAAKEEAEAKEAAAEEARDTISASPISSPKPPNGLLPSTVPDRPSPLSVSSTPGRPSPLSISTTNERPKRPVPGPLDLTSAQGNRSAAPPSALASARIIEDLNVVPYPETIKTPNPDLNIAATPGKFRYDREFLLQFMGVCKERPDSLPALDVIGLEPGEAGAGYANTGRPDRRRVGSLGMGNAPPLQRQASIGLGLGTGLANRSGFAMGNFQSPSNSQSRFEASNAGRPGGMPFAGGAASRLTPMSRSASQGGVGGGGPREAKRTRSQRGRDRGDNPRASGFQTPANQVANFEPVVPLEQSENRWVAGSTQRNPQQVEERQIVDRKVKALLNKLTMEKFDSISDQIIEWANKSEQEKDGSTLMQVIKLVFEKAKDEAAFSEMYARLCRKMMERVSPNVQDETIKNSEGQPITGGMLFRKYLLNRCQEDFERGWSAKEAALAAAALKSGEDKAAEAASGDSGEAVLYSDEYYAAAKAKRQGLGLVRFIGELFKLQMLTERIMHECIKKLLSNVVNPEEEEIESLCKLLTTVGQSLDNPKARNHMDIYFERMQDMAKSSNINSRMQFMLLDVIELRSRHWQSRANLPRPPPAHQDSSRDDSGKHGVTRGGSRRGEQRGNGTEPDGWNVAGGASASRPSTRAGDLSQFGKISKPTGIQFGPSSVFNKRESSKRDSSIGRAGGANMFSALSAGVADGPPPPERTTSSRKPSIDLGPGGFPASGGTGERKKIVLQPKTVKTESDGNKAEEKEEEKEEVAPAAMTEEEAETKVKEDVKEYLSVENIDEAIMALEALPSEHRHLFVDKLINASMDGGNKVVALTEKLFSAVRSRSVITAEGFERGMLPTIEMADDLSIDVPKTYEWLARMIHAAGLDKAKTEEMAGKISVYGEPRVPPRELLLKEFEKVSSA
ncbi:Eukaryotic translation initiation factor 4 gamma [Rhizoctonia solani]|uniref:Eukaryotic translation initiation factor 4 gamma n=1 Tax=Rhizoctonia solani TaxID=456999 RepID=A0A0K6G2K2_9AGAM|nr:Eukaryotic translation initiation factor 4 gamma [Rhizoctonia solani]